MSPYLLVLGLIGLGTVVSSSSIFECNSKNRVETTLSVRTPSVQLSLAVSLSGDGADGCEVSPNPITFQPNSTSVVFELTTGGTTGPLNISFERNQFWGFQIQTIVANVTCDGNASNWWTSNGAWIGVIIAVFVASLIFLTVFCIRKNMTRRISTLSSTKRAVSSVIGSVRRVENVEMDSGTAVSRGVIGDGEEGEDPLWDLTIRNHKTPIGASFQIEGIDKYIADVLENPPPAAAAVANTITWYDADEDDSPDKRQETAPRLSEVREEDDTSEEEEESEDSTVAKNAALPPEAVAEKKSIDVTDKVHADDKVPVVRTGSEGHGDKVTEPPLPIRAVPQSARPLPSLRPLAASSSSSSMLPPAKARPTKETPTADQAPQTPEPTKLSEQDAVAQAAAWIKSLTAAAGGAGGESSTTPRGPTVPDAAFESHSPKKKDTGDAPAQLHPLLKPTNTPSEVTPSTPMSLPPTIPRARAARNQAASNSGLSGPRGDASLVVPPSVDSSLLPPSFATLKSPAPRVRLSGGLLPSASRQPQQQQRLPPSLSVDPSELGVTDANQEPPAKDIESKSSALPGAL